MFRNTSTVLSQEDLDPRTWHDTYKHIFPPFVQRNRESVMDARASRELDEDFGKSLFRALAKLSPNLHFDGDDGGVRSDDCGGGHTDICPGD